MLKALAINKMVSYPLSPTNGSSNSWATSSKGLDFEDTILGLPQAQAKFIPQGEDRCIFCQYTLLREHTKISKLHPDIDRISQNALIPLLISK